ncbi:MAG: sulfotransferase [Calditrichaeota bacterium]|nr:MAG: sulfotransferase [Calditrichota bacterium]
MGVNHLEKVQLEGKAALSDEPFFIFGCARSGTSLLSRMLNSHPKLAVPYESHLFNTFYPWLKYYGDLSVRANLERLVDDILRTDVMQDWTPPLDRGEILSSVRTPDFGGVMDAVMCSWASKQNKSRWGEKTPHHIYFWDQISTFFPKARIIHIVRDGRDVALSLLNARFGPKSIYAGARFWVAYLRQVERVKAQVDKRRIFELRYEELLAAPERLLSQVCEFLGEDYTPAMLEYHKTGTNYKTDKHNQENLKKPVLSDNKEKWRTRMTPDDLRVFEAVAGEMLLRYGYETALQNPQISASEVFYRRYVESLSKKGYALLRNRKGHRDALIRMGILARLVIRNKFRGN